MSSRSKPCHAVLACAGIVALLVATPCSAQKKADARPNQKKKQFRGVIGADSKKVKVVDGKTLLWASGDPDSPDSQWYDFTGSPIPAEKLQFGIGKDRIRAIDDPLFVDPDDPRLLKLLQTGRRSKKQPQTNDQIEVIGFADGDDARAYPVALLDHHELVNDRVAGKPVTVGW